MMGWMKGDKKRGQATEAFKSIAKALPELYRDCLYPVEKHWYFHSIYSAALTDADFVSKPMVLLIGQYSAGKSTFVKHLLGRDYPGLRIGPEPTTDKFVAIAHGDQDQVIPGNAACVDKSMPFTQLSNLGNNFLSRFEVAKMPSACLAGITLIDSPGVLSGEKQRVNRGYIFENVVKWFCDRVDMVIIIFDVQKLDISDEFKKALLATKGNDSKVHVLLNKADRCTTSQLMRVYGALMWNLGKVLNTPEVCRVYIGSFWDEPLENDENQALFKREEEDLYKHLAMLPRGASVRKMNDLIKRARLAKVHSYIMEHMRHQLPMVGKTNKWKAMTTPEGLEQIFKNLSQQQNIPLGDFPNTQFLSQKLSDVDCKSLEKMKKFEVVMEKLDKMLSVQVPQLIQLIPSEAQDTEKANILNVGGESPFGSEARSFEKINLLDAFEAFMKLQPVGKRAQQEPLVNYMRTFKLNDGALHKIWTLAKDARLEGDMGHSSSMDLWQFAVIVRLCTMKSKGKDLPVSLEPFMKPTPEAIATASKYLDDPTRTLAQLSAMHAAPAA